MSCLVSGGGSGIGRAAAILISRNMPVVVADIDGRLAASVAEEINDVGGTAIAVKCDVRRYQQCEEVVETAEGLGPLTDVVSTAGILGRGDGPLADCAPEAWADVIEVNLTGTANLLRAAIPALLRTGGGDIILVSSAAALIGRPGLAAYSASKAGLIGLQRSIVADYSKRGVRCNCVCPGPTNTPMTKTAGYSLPNAMGRQAEPQEIASVIAWLVADDSNWTNGQTMAVDAGETAAVARAFEQGGK